MTTTARARLTGLAATLLLVGIVVGLPLVLLAIGASPIPGTLPSLDAVRSALLSPDDGTLALTAVTVIAWVSWAFLTGSILLEVGARARRIRAPRLPGLRVPQSAAHGLVGAALMLFVALPTTPAVPTGAAPAEPTVTSAAAVDTHPAPAPTATAPADPSAGHTHRQHPAHHTSTKAGRPATVSHTVQPGETLWSIAERRLGSGPRYREIIDLNRRVLGDDPDFLRPGAVLRLPAGQRTTTTGHPTHTVTVHHGDTLSQIAQDELGDATRYPEIAAASQDTTQPGGAHLTDPDVIDVGWTLTIPGTPPEVGGPAHEDHAGHARGSRAGRNHRPAMPPTPTSPDAAARAKRATRPAETRTPPAKAADPGPRAPRSTAAPTDAGSTTGAASALQAAGRDQADLLLPLGTAEPQVPTAPWILTGFTGGGVLLAGSTLLALRRRRQAQFRHRRPGRSIAAPPPQLAPVEKTVTAVGSTTAATVDLMDAVLRRMAARQATSGEPLPRLAAVELTRTELVLHLSAGTAMPPPWQDRRDQRRWACPADVDLDQVGQGPSDAAPYPLLVTLGSSDTGQVWLLNCEDPAAISINGDPTYARDFARYLAAELAVNPWSAAARVDCIGVADEVATMSPRRIHYHQTPGDITGEALAEAIALIDRAAATGHDVPTARGHGAGDDVWAARLLLIDAAHQDLDGDHDAVQQLLQLVSSHPAQTGTAIVLAGDHEQTPGTVIRVTANGRVSLPDAALDLIAVGLTSDEAQGCAALLAQSEDNVDTDMPVTDEPGTGWRSFTNAAGALRDEHTTPRTSTAAQDSPSILDGPDEDYLATGATTRDDLRALAPRVPAHVRDDLAAADATLDQEVAAWFSDDCHLPRLTLLGPVRARTRGDAVAVAKRKPYATELLAYLAIRPHGATPAQLADAFGISDGRARTDIKMVRDWLGVDPRTGRKHLPNARESAAAQARGIGVYQVDDLLVDADLFRRLRARGETRGPEGLDDLRRALALVQGPPFDQLRPGGWSWLAEGDRLDQHMLCAIVDVAHTVTTAALLAGDLPRARSAAELAAQAAPHEEIPRLDLAAVAEAEGHHGQAERILRDQVCNRSDDDDAPTELPDRTQKIIRNRGWLDPDPNPDRAAS